MPYSVLEKILRWTPNRVCFFPFPILSAHQRSTESCQWVNYLLVWCPILCSFESTKHLPVSTANLSLCMDHIPRNCTIISWILEWMVWKPITASFTTCSVNFSRRSQPPGHLSKAGALLGGIFATAHCEQCQLICWSNEGQHCVCFVDTFSFIGSAKCTSSSCAGILFAGGNSQHTWSSPKIESCQWEIYLLPSVLY